MSTIYRDNAINYIISIDISSHNEHSILFNICNTIVLIVHVQTIVELSGFSMRLSHVN